jgi:hypothetical protein
MTIKAELDYSRVGDAFYVQGKEHGNEIVAVDEVEGSLGNYEFRISPTVGEAEEFTGGHISFKTNRLRKRELSEYARGDIAAITVYPTGYETVLELKSGGTILIALNEGNGKSNNVRFIHEKSK